MLVQILNVCITAIHKLIFTSAKIKIMNPNKSTFLTLLAVMIFTTGCFDISEEEADREKAAKQHAINSLEEFNKGVKRGVRNAKKVQKIKDDKKFAPKAKKVLKDYIETFRKLTLICEDLAKNTSNKEEAKAYNDGVSLLSRLLTSTSIDIEIADVPELRKRIKSMASVDVDELLEASNSLLRLIK